MPPRSPDRTPLVLAYRRLTGDTRARVLRHAEQVWAGMESWSDAAADRMVGQLLPVTTAGQRSAAAATAAFLHSYLGTPGSRARPVDLAAVTGFALRGVDPQVVYRRPVIEARATYARLKKAGQLDRQQVIDQAVAAGLRRLLGTASTDLQLTATLTSREVLQAQGVTTYRRVTRQGACPLCVAASDRVYNTADLLPIHTGCSCVVIPGGLVPEALQRASNIDDPTAARGLKISENGEIGPVLEWGEKTKGASRRDRPSGGESRGGGSRGGGKPPAPGGSASEPPEDDGKPTYENLLAETDRVAPSDDPDMYYEHPKEAAASDSLRRLGIYLRSVRRVDSVRGLANPDSVWDALAVTADIKHPESTNPSTWGKLLSEAARKANAAFFDTRLVADGVSREAAAVIMTRAMGGHGRGDRIDHVLVFGETEGEFWYVWAKGGPP